MISADTKMVCRGQLFGKVREEIRWTAPMQLSVTASNRLPRDTNILYLAIDSN